MKNQLLFVVALFGALTCPRPAPAQGTAFTYQGQLQDSGSPANGAYDLTFALFSANLLGSQLGGTLTNTATPVTNGLFTVTLDFGANFPGADRWLEIGVSTNGAGGFSTLTPRQPLLPAPYAITAANALTATAAAQVTGPIADPQLSANVPLLNGTNAFAGPDLFSGTVQATNAANQFTGSFTGDGSGLTNLSIPAAQLTGGLDAGQLTSGTLALAQLPGSVLTNGASGTGLTGLALLNGGNTFSGDQIVSGGSLGIGTTTPAAALEVNGSAQFDSITTFGSLLRLDSSSGFSQSSDGPLNVDAPDVAGGRFTVLTGGNVGIGTNNPSQLLEVNGNAQIDGVLTGDGSGLTNLSIPAGNITSGTLALAQLPASVVTNGASGLNLTGAFTGNGAGITNVNLATINSQGGISFIPTYTYPGNFRLAATLNAGSFPISLVAADVNGDGQMDLIAANHDTSTLTVLTNAGNGGFGLAATLALGHRPNGLVAADVNGDSRVDLISSSGPDNDLTVLTNNGSGGFALAATLAVGTAPTSVVAADINRDGQVDLISGNQGDNTLTVLTNNGLGGFALAATLTVGNRPQSVVAADINRDGRVDLISANSLDNNLTVLTNNGTGGFALAATLAVGNRPRSVVAADVNGDGRVDLISANQGDNALTVLTNNGLGGFALAITVGVGLAPASTVAADVNHDGHLDLITANTVENTLTVLTNIPTFTGNILNVNGQFTGNGSGLTNLSIPAGNITSGTLALAQLPGSVITNGASGTGLTGLALLNGGNTFSGDQIVSGGSLGIGTTTPAAALEVNGSAQFDSITTFGSQLRLNSNDGFSQSSAGPLNVDAPNVAGGRFTVLTGGNVGIGNPSPDYLLTVGTGGAYCNGTTWVNGSDRNSKQDIAPLDPQAVLAKVASLPITEWQYKVDADGARHLGPMAQDFHAAFGLNGADDKHISTVDESGVALAAIQGLNQKLAEKAAEIQELKARLEKLEHLLLEKK